MVLYFVGIWDTQKTVFQFLDGSDLHRSIERKIIYSKNVYLIYRSFHIKLILTLFFDDVTTSKNINESDIKILHPNYELSGFFPTS